MWQLEYKQAWRLHKTGVGATAIAKQLGIGRSTVYKVLQETG